MNKKKLRILMVEDDALDQMAFMRLVEDQKLSYDCTIAGSVSEVRHILSSKTFDIIIADYLLGDGTAFDIIDSAKDTPIIFITGAGNEEVAVKAWKAGAFDYLIKDYERNYLKVLPIRVENVVRHKKAEDKLKQYDRLKGGLAITVSHELKTSLRIFRDIITNAIAGKLGPTSNELQKKLETADRIINRLAKTISDFLDISKIETGKIELRKTKVDVQQIVSEAIFLLSEMADEKKIKLLGVCPPDPAFSVHADYSMVRQIFVNLIDNAIKFSPMGSTIQITIKDMKDEVQVNMQDNSIGIGNEDIRDAFNRFVQSDEYAGPGTPGTGLGLYIAKQLIAVQGGQIWAESTPGEGSIFCFTLPKSVPQEPVASAAAGAERRQV